MPDSHWEQRLSHSLAMNTACKVQARGLVLLASLLLATLVAAQTAPGSVAELSDRLSKALPERLPGWTVTQPPQPCDRECLADVLPQDAELALQYRLLWGLRLQLMPPEPQQQIEARVYCMAEEVDAFGLFARHYEATTIPAQIATQSFWAANELHLWRGAFYLRLVPSSADRLLRASVVAAAEAIAAEVPIPEKLPLLMQLLPQARQAPYSLRYYRRDVLGLPALADGLVARYLEDNTTFTLALLRAPDEAAADALLGVVTRAIAEGAATTTVPDLGRTTLIANTTQYGLSYLMVEGRYVALALGVHDRETAEGLLRITGTNIRISRF